MEGFAGPGRGSSCGRPLLLLPLLLLGLSAADEGKTGDRLSDQQEIEIKATLGGRCQLMDRSDQSAEKFVSAVRSKVENIYEEAEPLSSGSVPERTIRFFSRN